MPWLVVANSTIVNVVEYDGVSEFPLLPGQSLVDYTGTALAAPGFGWSGTDPVPPAGAAAPSIRAQGAAALRRGVAVTFAVQTALSGTYAVDETAQNRLNRIYALIIRAGGVFPEGASTLHWADMAGNDHVFGDVPTFMAFADALSRYELAIDQAALVGIGPLPDPAIAIAL